MPASKTRSGRRRSTTAAAAPEAARGADAGRALRIAGPLAIAAGFAAMLAWTWRTWPDPFIDYGREIYLAWQVSEGRTLYRDLAHFNGPLSALANGLVLRLAGPGILHLALANAVFVAAVAAAGWALVARTADRTAAALAGLVFVGMFAFGRFTRLGNYNWLCPYSYELPHGVGLALASLWCLVRHRATSRPGWLVAAGGGLGLVALTKAEVLLAAAPALGVGLVLSLWGERGRARALGAVGLGVAAPLAAAFAWFARDLPVADVLAWPLGYWRTASRPEFVTMPMYQEGIGLGDVGGNVRRLGVAAAWIAAALAPGLVAAWALRARAASPPRDAVIGLAVGATAWWLVSMDGWFAAARVLPVVAALVVVASGIGWLRAADRAEADRQALRAALGVLALGLLAKMLLNVRVFHYGFALALPATWLAVAALVAWLPAAVGRSGGAAPPIRAVAVGLVLAALAAHVGFQRRLIAAQRYAIGSGPDQFFGDDRVGPLRALMDEIRARVPRGGTLAVLPEGILVSYLTRRASSVRYVQYSPLTVLLWGEARLRADFEAAPPDFVALVHRDNAHEGARWFGTDYATSVLDVVRERYRPVWRIGAEPLRDHRFGIVLYERAAATPIASGGP